MTQLHIISLAGLLSIVYLGCVFVIGCALGHRFTSAISSQLERCGFLLLTGLLAHACLSATLLWLAPAWSGAALWLLVALSALATPWWRSELRGLGKPLLLLALYTIACYTLLLAYHYGPARGPTLFWSIYNLTHITPGDSPQAAFQAQYLLQSGQLQGGQDFALFDRPFLGGVITAGALSSFGLQFTQQFYDYTDLIAFCYAGLWIAINAICILPLLNLIERFSAGRTARIIAVLLLVSPFLVYNIIGLWPKLLALALLCYAATNALRGRWQIAVLLSSASFFAHGSFLWAHISFCGVLFFAAIASGLRASAIPWKQPIAIVAACLIAPLLWFGAEHMVGGATPLRAYYLYNVDVTYGVTHSTAEAAHSFYSSTSMANIEALPWINMLKGILPVETLNMILNFGIAGESISWRKLGESLFQQQFARVWFAFGLVGGLITWRGAFHNESGRWLPRLALIAFFILPLIPGLGLYRRDDHFILPIMVFSTIPILISFCIGMRTLRERTMTLLALWMLAEFFMVYFWRYPPGRLIGEFHAYYLAAVTLAILAAAATILLSGTSKLQNEPMTDPNGIGGV